ncbi:glycerophosphoryl diester phosphodiesterase [Halomonas elongata]|uniref:Glycerophosphoryl diester phosphodiesterase n=1 Tax=Halomonas elongata TaxID=2746 RepID=A0A1B8P598_HALEL|nr:glycerophosphoryl diester phosphodiesterase [Halomonas elongata]
MPQQPLAPPRLIAHRGLSARAPENTLAAVRAAHEAGCRWVELDVQLLGDGTPVIWHDRDVSRCSNGRGRLVDLDIARARQLDAGSWFAAEFAGEPMATLERMLTLIDELALGLNLELKVNRGRDPEALVERALPPLLEALPAERLIVSSFDASALAHARRQAPAERLPLGGLFERVPATGPPAVPPSMPTACTPTGAACARLAPMTSSSPAMRCCVTRPTTRQPSPHAGSGACMA